MVKDMAKRDSHKTANFFGARNTSKQRQSLIAYLECVSYFFVLIRQAFIAVAKITNDVVYSFVLTSECITEYAINEKVVFEGQAAKAAPFKTGPVDLKTHREAFKNSGGAPTQPIIHLTEAFLGRPRL